MGDFRQNSLHIHFDEESQLFSVYELWEEAQGQVEECLFTQYSLSDLQGMGKDKASYAIGAEILSKIEMTGKMLFPPRNWEENPEGEEVQIQENQVNESIPDDFRHFRFEGRVKAEGGFVVEISPPYRNEQNYTCDIYCPFLFPHKDGYIQSMYGLNPRQARKLALELVHNLLKNISAQLYTDTHEPYTLNYDEKYLE